MNLPELQELLALRGTARQLTLHAAGAARGPLQGSHRSAHRGRGLEFQEVRLYVAGDDARSIDWRVTARRGRPHTRLYHEERERPVWLLADLSPSLFFGSRRQLKSAVVVRAAALLAWVAAHGGDRVGAVIAGAHGRRILPPRAREAGVLPILSALIELQPRAPGPDSPHALDDSLRALVPLVRPGSLILALSDFATLGLQSEALWSPLAAHNDGRIFWITDALEEQGLPHGRFRVGSVDRLTIVDGASVRGRWLEQWRARESRVTDLAKRFRIPLERLDTREPTADVLRSTLHSTQSAA